MAATIKDVARMANVSISTVSRVTSNASNVSPEIRKRVLRAISKLGYTPSVIAKSLAVRSLCNIAVLMGRTKNMAFENPDFMQILDGLSNSLGKQNYNPVLCTNANPKEEMELCMNLVLTGAVQGAVVVGSFRNDPLLERLVEAHTPFALIGFPSGQPDIHTMPYNSVGTDDYSDSYEAVSYLIKRGHRRIGHIYSSLDYTVNRKRYQGYIDAMANHGLPVGPELVEEADYSRESSYAAAQRLLSLPNRPTALFCMDDYKAVSALSVATVMHLRVPEDISIMGHNDYRISTLVYPALTTVYVPLYHLGSNAADLVVQAIRRPEETIKNIILTSHIVERDSVAEPPRQ